MLPSPAVSSATAAGPLPDSSEASRLRRSPQTDGLEGGFA